MNTADSNTIKFPRTLVEAVRYFEDPTVSLAFFTNLRWPEQVCCPRCGSTNVLFMAKYSRWKCREKHVQPQFTVKVGTIMEDSPLSLDKWAVAFWLEVNAKNCISSYELHRALGITQKSAWFMLHRIRLALQSGSFDKFGGNGGTVECDETFVGGLAKNMHKARRHNVIKCTLGSGKTAVMGLLERHNEKGKSKVRAKVIPNTQRETLHAEIVNYIEPGANVYTDAWSAYRTMPEVFAHEFVDHMERYVRGAVHTNGLENFWSLFKRCLNGTHVSVEPFHLAAYVDSEAFRFNHRDMKDGERFVAASRGMSGKRLTYKELTASLERVPENDRAGENGAGLPN